MVENEYTTISVKVGTKETVEKIGNKGETWDDLLTRMTKVYNLCEELHGPLDDDGIEALRKKLIRSKGKRSEGE